MVDTAGMERTNWKADITFRPRVVKRIKTVSDIQAAVRDRASHPSPVVAAGSQHSTTRCIAAEGGTILDMTGMNAILSIDKDSLTFTAQAGVAQIDAAKALERAGLQLYTNLEIGNMTLGAGAVAQTKDASFHARGAWEFGQFNSYCVGMKLVQADGSTRVVTEGADPTLMAALRSSFGLLGIVYEVTFRVKPLRAVAVSHESYTVNEFAGKLDALLERKESIMLYMYPFRDRVVVEYRTEGAAPARPGSLAWKVRNATWKTLWPFMANLLTFLPLAPVRNAVNAVLNRLTMWVQTRLLHDSASAPADQIIRYAETAGFASYTFSIWAIDRDRYADAILAYFAFCKDYAQRTGYRCELVNVGYHIVQDQSSLLSYTRHADCLTLDPVATGRDGWFDFLKEYNEFCSNLGGRPLLNQTPLLSAELTKKAFGQAVEEFKKYLQLMDPERRFMNGFFKNILDI